MNRSQHKERDFNKAWTTVNELEAIDYMASSKPRAGSKQYETITQRKQKLKNYISNSYLRIWPHEVSVEQCRNHAKILLAKLEIAA